MLSRRGERAGLAADLGSQCELLVGRLLELLERGRHPTDEEAKRIIAARVR